MIRIYYSLKSKRINGLRIPVLYTESDLSILSKIKIIFTCFMECS